MLFTTAVLMQVLFMNNLQFSGLVNPYFYILFILILPVNMSRVVLLLLGFLLGITIDAFSNTPGIHASATVFVSFLRPFMINAANLEDQEKGMLPTIANFGFRWFFQYAAVLVLLHHFFLFFVEVFSFHNFFSTFFRSILSSIFTLFFIGLSQFIIFRK